MDWGPGIVVRHGPLLERHLSFELRGGVASANSGGLLDCMERFAALAADRGYSMELATSRGTSGALTIDGWTRVRAAVLGRSLDWVALSTVRRMHTAGKERSRASVSAQGFVDPLWGGVLRVECSMTWGTEPGQAPPVLSLDEYLEVCRAACAATGMPQGRLVPYGVAGLIGGQTSHERELFHAVVLLGRPSSDYGPAALERFARGSAWALWLTDGHIQRLGGWERVSQDAPAARVERRPGGVWLELTESPWDVPAEALSRLDSFLRPILPTAAELVAADPELPLPSRRPPRVTATDRYRSFTGADVGVEWIGGEEDGFTVNVHLARRPSAAAVRSLERLAHAWYLEGAEGRFAPPLARGVDPSGFHNQTPPDWDGRVVRWNVDLGGAQVDVRAATGELGRRLAAWSEKTGCEVKALRIGRETP